MIEVLNFIQHQGNRAVFAAGIASVVVKVPQDELSDQALNLAGQALQLQDMHPAIAGMQQIIPGRICAGTERLGADQRLQLAGQGFSIGFFIAQAGQHALQGKGRVVFHPGFQHPDQRRGLLIAHGVKH